MTLYQFKLSEILIEYINFIIHKTVNDVNNNVDNSKSMLHNIFPVFAHFSLLKNHTRAENVEHESVSSGFSD